MNCDFLGIVTEGFTILEAVFSNMCLVELFKLNCSCLIISPSEQILMYELINLHDMIV